MASPSEEIEIIENTINGEFVQEPDCSQETRNKLLDSLLDLETFIAEKKVDKAKNSKSVNCFKCGQKYSKTNISKHYKNCDGLVSRTITCCKCKHEYSKRGFQAHFKTCKGNKAKVPPKKNKKDNISKSITNKNQQDIKYLEES